MVPATELYASALRIKDAMAASDLNLLSSDASAALTASRRQLPDCWKSFRMSR